jgi:hypothetical protein
MNNNYEKLVKTTIKHIAKLNNLDYEKLKVDAKKIIKLAKNYDEQLLGMMEELLDINNVSCEEELVDIDIDVLKIYCRIKEIDLESSSDRGIRRKVWENIEMENEFDESEDSDESDESDNNDFIEDVSESEQEPEPEPEPVVSTKNSKERKESKKKVKKDVSVVNQTE